MIRKSHGSRLSHELAPTSNVLARAAIFICLCALVSCNAASGDASKLITPATETIVSGSEVTVQSTSSASLEPTILSTRPPPIPSSTPTATPTPSPFPTPFLTPPPSGGWVAIPILMYHHLESLGQNASLVLRTWTVSPDSFGEQLDYLAAHNYHTITFGQLDSFFGAANPLPIHPVILTFDDGWSDDYHIAFPALQKRGMVGTFFVPTSYAGAPGGTLLSWDQISEMDAAGMEFGGHTINHADLKKVSNEEALRQLSESKSKMEVKLGHPTIAFAYPFGDYNADVVALVRQAGYHEAVGLCCDFKIRAESLLTLPRIRISYDDTLADLAKKLPPDNP